MAELLESTMLICFGLSWPMNLAKNIKARSARNMSLQFILLIITGYVAGISAKIYNHRFNYVLVVYLLNLVVVSANVVVYFINRRYDRQMQTANAELRYPDMRRNFRPEIQRILPKTHHLMHPSNHQFRNKEKMKWKLIAS